MRERFNALLFVLIDSGILAIKCLSDVSESKELIFFSMDTTDLVHIIGSEALQARKSQRFQHKHLLHLQDFLNPIAILI